MEGENEGSAYTNALLYDGTLMQTHAVAPMDPGMERTTAVEVRFYNDSKPMWSVDEVAYWGGDAARAWVEDPYATRVVDANVHNLSLVLNYGVTNFTLSVAVRANNLGGDSDLRGEYIRRWEPERVR